MYVRTSEIETRPALRSPSDMLCRLEIATKRIVNQAQVRRFPHALRTSLYDAFRVRRKAKAELGSVYFRLISQ